MKGLQICLFSMQNISLSFLFSLFLSIIILTKVVMSMEWVSEVSYIFDIYLEFIHMLQVSVFPVFYFNECISFIF